MARQSLRIGIAAAAVALCAAGVAARAEGMRIVEDRKLEPGGKLVMEADAGSVELKGGASSGAHIVITSDYEDTRDNFDFKYEESAGQLKIIVKKKGSEGWLHISGKDIHAPHFEIKIPTQTAVDVKTGGGHIELDSVKGTATLRTSGGHVEVNELEGPLKVETSGGHISLKGVTGDASVETSGGHIEASTLKGKLHAETSGGHISLKDVSGDIDASTSGGHISITGAGGRVKAETSGGHVEVAFARGNARGGEIESSGGGVTVSVDPSLGFDVDAETGGGTVNSDVPITIEGRQSKSSLKGTIGRGGEALHLRTSAGSINIEKL